VEPGGSQVRRGRARPAAHAGDRAGRRATSKRRRGTASCGPGVGGHLRRWRPL